MDKLASRGLSFRRLLFSISAYSTSAVRVECADQAYPLVDYLVDSLGFPRKEAIATSTKAYRVNFKSTEKPDSVVDFFRRNGFDDGQLRKVVSSEPNLLSTTFEKTLEPKFRFLRGIGLEGLNLVRFITSCPSILRRSLEKRIVPSVNYLKELLGSEKDVVETIRRSIWVLMRNVPQTMQPNVIFLKERGFTDEEIRKFIIFNSNFFMRKPEQFKGLLHKVEVEMGIPSYSAMFFHGIYVADSISKSKLEAKFRIFKDFGWADSEIYTMARRLPYCLSMSESKIKIGLKYFMEGMGLSPLYLANRPALLMYSLQKRVVPRNEVLKTLKGKKLLKRKTVLYSVVTLSEKKFLMDFVLPYKNVLPDMCKAYMKSRGATEEELN